MSQEPDSYTLLTSAVGVLKDSIAPELSGTLRYEVLLVANAIGIAARELSRDQRDTAQQVARLAELADIDDTSADSREDAIPALETALCMKIRSGSFDSPDERASLLSYLRTTVLNTLQETNPRLAKRRRAE